MELSRAIEHALDGNAILFIGAGFPAGALNVKNRAFKRGRELADFLANAVSLPPGTPLDDAAEAYLEAFSEDALIRLIQEEFSVRNVTASHRTFARVPWTRVYTTNYDNVLERCYALEEKPLVPITLDSDPYLVSKDSTLCVHLNGFVDRLDRTTFTSLLKLTETSYLTEAISASPWAVLFREDLRLTPAVFFVGYSLYDLDIKRILFESPPLKDKCFFFLGPEPSPETRRRISRFGSLENLSTEALAKLFAQKAKTYAPVEHTLITGVAIKETSAPVAREKISDKDFLDLLLWGARSDGRLAESLVLKKRYFLERSAFAELLILIEKGHRLLAVCSNLGNGKSLFLDGVRLRAAEQGYRVFDVQERTANVSQELVKIAHLPGKIMVIIEEYQGWLDDIQLFRLNSTSQAVMLVSARNSIHDVLVDDLAKKAGVAEIPEIQLDRLSEADVLWIVDAFNEFGWWGELAKRSRQEKADFVARTCRGQMHAVLLKLLESPDIARRLRESFASVASTTPEYNLILSVLILTLINERPTIDVLVDLWGVQAINVSRLRKNAAFREFLDPERDEIRVRSPIAAQYLLKKIVDPAAVVDVLVHIAKKADVACRGSERYRRLMRQLITFSSVQGALPDKEGAEAIFRYYESTKNLRFCARNPLFWLQYAIASLVAEDLFRAERYFKTAYSLAEKGSGFDTFQIDNHYARFLLLKAIREGDVKDAMAKFRRVRSILNRQIENERVHYPYRVAIGYREFLEKYEDELGEKEVQEIQKAAEKLLTNIEGLADSLKGHPSVRECKKAMEAVAKKGDKILKRKRGT